MIATLKIFSKNNLTPKNLTQFGTYIYTKEGFAYLTSIMDLFSRKIIAWRLSKTLEAKWVVEYAAYNYQDKLREYGIRQSMSAKGDCFDDAPMESFFVTLKK